MSDANLIRQLQKQLAEAEVERLRLVEELARTSNLAVTLGVLAEREACARLATFACEDRDCDCSDRIAAEILKRGAP